MNAPQEPSSQPAAVGPDDDVVDGELVDDGTGTLAGGDDADDATDADIAPDDPADSLVVEAETEQQSDPASASAAAMVADPSATPPATSPVTGVLPAAASPTPTFDYTDAGVPTLDYVRDKIEHRFGAAQGTTELNESSSAGQQRAELQSERDRLAREKLEEIRKSVGGP